MMVIIIIILFRNIFFTVAYHACAVYFQLLFCLRVVILFLSSHCRRHFYCYQICIVCLFRAAQLALSHCFHVHIHISQRTQVDGFCNVAERILAVGCKNMLHVIVVRRATLPGLGSEAWLQISGTMNADLYCFSDCNSEKGNFITWHYLLNLLFPNTNKTVKCEL